MGDNRNIGSYWNLPFKTFKERTHQKKVTEKSNVILVIQCDVTRENLGVSLSSETKAGKKCSRIQLAEELKTFC